ncbi:BPSS1780 family membrane protein [Neisseriaceae bacterium JH1-16]|nr:BPSS1780 family membrane protein [Neisseriaceae bacterium JH1-16]
MSLPDSLYPSPAGVSPRKVGAGRGWRWIVEAFYLVRPQPLTWVLLALTFIVINLAISLVPGIGQVLSFLLSPVFAGGFVLAAHKASQGGELELTDLFEGFRRALQPLFGVALFCIVLVSVALLLIGVIGSALGVGVNASGSVGAGVGFSIVLVVLAVVLGFAIGAATWFAPPLVTLSGQGAWEAVKNGVRGGLLNWPAMLVCGVMMTLLFGLALLPLGLGLLLWFPVMYVTGYTAWRDVFGEPLPS